MPPIVLAASAIPNDIAGGWVSLVRVAARKAVLVACLDNIIEIIFCKALVILKSVLCGWVLLCIWFLV